MMDVRMTRLIALQDQLEALIEQTETVLDQPRADLHEAALTQIERGEIALGAIRREIERLEDDGVA